MTLLRTGTRDAVQVISRTGRRAVNQFMKHATLLGKGGAGHVYAHPDLPDQAVKIYSTRDRAIAHEAKVRAMMATPPDAIRSRSGAVQIAWPNATVEQDGMFIGFVMPKIDFAKAWKLQQVIMPAQRERRGVPERMDLRLYAGRNLASVLVSLHRIGHYVLDLKPQNVLVYRDDAKGSAAHIALVDCDGFQIRGADGARFFAQLATADFLHPVVAKQFNDEPSFDADLLNKKAALQDDFALAVILFQLLNDGLHPMSGRVVGNASVPSQTAMRLQKGGQFYPYKLDQPNPLILPDADSLHEWYDRDLRKLFDRAFGGGENPPGAKEWMTILDQLSREEYRCRRNADHWRFGAECGQCALAVQQPVSTPSRVSSTFNPIQIATASSASTTAVSGPGSLTSVPWTAANTYVANLQNSSSSPAGITPIRHQPQSGFLSDSAKVLLKFAVAFIIVFGYFLWRYLPPAVSNVQAQINSIASFFTPEPKSKPGQKAPAVPDAKRPQVPTTTNW